MYGNQEGNSVRATLNLVKENSNGVRNQELSIDLRSIFLFFITLLGVAFAVVGACAFGYGLYVAIFLNRI